MGVLTWSPLAFGFLTGRYRQGATGLPDQGRAALRPEWFDPRDPVTARKLEVVERLVEIADDLGITLPALAVAFPLAHRAVSGRALAGFILRSLSRLAFQIGTVQPLSVSNAGASSGTGRMGTHFTRNDSWLGSFSRSAATPS